MKVRFVAAALLIVGAGSAPEFAGAADAAAPVIPPVPGPVYPQINGTAIESFKPADERARRRTELMLQRFSDQAYQN